MKKILLLSSILLLSAVWAVAQSDSKPSTSTETTQTTQTTTQSAMDSSSKTIVGCLAGSDGSFTLTDKSGTAYKLSGDTAKMQAHVGHTVSVTGTSSASSSASSSSTMGKDPSSMSGSADSPSTLTVTSFKHVSPTCDSAH